MTSGLSALPELRRRVRKSAMGSESWLMGIWFEELSGLLDAIAEGHAELAEEELGVLVGFGGGDDGDVEADLALDLVQLDLGKDGLIRDAEGVIAAAVKGARGDAAEVADAGQRHLDETLEKLVH